MDKVILKTCDFGGCTCVTSEISEIGIYMCMMYVCIHL